MSHTSPHTMQPLRKLWGTTLKIHASAVMSVDLITVLPYHRCSRHHHEHKANKFFVKTGVLFVIVVDPITHRETRHRLCVNDTLTVAPGVVHWFETAAIAVEAVEVYWGDQVSFDDIVRQDEGGKINVVVSGDDA